MTKKEILDVLIQTLETKLAALVASAFIARDAATSEESKPENKYDTRGLEAAYLAGAQAERAEKLRESIHHLKNMKIKPLDHVAISALVKLKDNFNHIKILFFLPLQGGETLNIGGQKVLTVTHEAPLAKELLGKVVGDAVAVTNKGITIEYEITEIL